MAKKSTGKIGGIRKIGPLSDKDFAGGKPKRIEPIEPVEGAEPAGDEFDEEFRAALPVIGEENAKIAQRMRRAGNMASIPVLLVEDWLTRHKVPYRARVSVPEAQAQVDVLVGENVAVRIQGGRFHPALSIQAPSQKHALTLMGLAVIDVREESIYRARDAVLSAALKGRETGPV